jgi:hypothetical protein
MQSAFYWKVGIVLWKTTTNRAGVDKLDKQENRHWEWIIQVACLLVKSVATSWNNNTPQI